MVSAGSSAEKRGCSALPGQGEAADHLAGETLRLGHDSLVVHRSPIMAYRSKFSSNSRSPSAALRSFT